ncbi:peptide chain release factor N(5)-glutamine methyltransferase [Pseudidiomarina planktonica]|nr:peptide chain release factor N(5)-glutamine methyltransferase [Pseudidiomarina planktonica]
MSIAELLEHASQQLQSSGSARLDAEVLLGFVLKKSRTQLRTWPEKIVTADEQEQFFNLLEQRKAGHPVAHLTGEREFWSLPLQVNNSTLIPRPDTETLVAAALDLQLPEQAEVLDLGTGTGAIALAIKSERHHFQVTAVDKSAAAVALAKENSARLQLPITVLESNWFSALEAEARFDLIVSNPPYIDAEDEHLSRGDVRFEPHSALVAQASGLADIQAIIDLSQHYLKPAGWLAIEHGWQQAEAVRDLFIKKGYKNVSSLADYANVDRVTIGRFSTAH